MHINIWVKPKNPGLCRCAVPTTSGSPLGSKLILGKMTHIPSKRQIPDWGSCSWQLEVTFVTEHCDSQYNMRKIGHRNNLLWRPFPTNFSTVIRKILYFLSKKRKEITLCIFLWLLIMLCDSSTNSAYNESYFCTQGS